MSPPDLTHLLVFDTATEQMNIGLVTPRGQWVIEEAGGARASARLIPLIRSLLEQASCQWSDLDAIGFGQGPGAFTGLRTACSVAQGLAFGAGKPVLAIDTLMAVAQDALGSRPESPAGSEALSVWVVMDARMDEIYAAHYRWEGGRWHVLAAPHLTSDTYLNHHWAHEAPQWVAGTAIQVYGDRLQPGPAAKVLAQALPRGAALIRLAQQAWTRGEAVDPALALPTYVRDKVAQTTAERLLAKAGSGA